MVNCALKITYQNGYTTEYPIDQVLAKLGLEPGAAEVRLGISHDGVEIHASVFPRETEYPGVTVDGSTPAMGDVWLGNFELPCPSYPTRIAARLYAGCHSYETDAPIAVVTHEVKDEPLNGLRAAKYRNAARPMKKLVYVDYDLADARGMASIDGHEPAEHLEDE